MVYRNPHAAPLSQIPQPRRGRTIGRFCLVCATIYPLHRGAHVGKPVFGRDHIASPCTHEGELFTPGAPWWEPAVEVLPEAAPQPGTAAATEPKPAAGQNPGTAASAPAATVATRAPAAPLGKPAQP